MDNKSINMSIKSFIFTLVFTFFIGAVLSAGATMLVFGSTQKTTTIKSNGDYEEYAVLDEIYDTYSKYYINELDKEELIVDAAKGMVYGTGDVYGAYFTQEEYKDFVMADNGEYVGIGVLINIGDNNRISVAQVYEGSPAEKAGIIPGDVLVGVDGEDTVGMDYSKVIDMVKGEEGTEVTVTFERNGEYLDFTMTRAHITADQAEWFMVEDGIGYIKIQEFSGNASELFHRALKELEEAGAKGYVLDLRNNPGGSKDIAVEIGDTLFPKGDIITLIDNEGNERVDRSDARYLNKPMVVLINGGSASASELLSGGIQDYGVGILVGETTFGKGVAQGFYFLDDGGVLRITSSYYETAGGRCPQDVGITPDYEVILDEEVRNNPALLTTDADNQMQKALEILKEEMAKEN
ncbi:MAG: S41 family peptidase [Eubacteriales bacterium]